LVIIVLCSTLALPQPTRSQAEFADIAATAVGTPTQQFQTFLPLTQAAPAVTPAPDPTPDPAPATPPTLLASYVIRDNPDYRGSFPGINVQYRPRQFLAGLQADSGNIVDALARVDDPGPYAGWDILNTPNEGVNTLASREDWLTLKLNRPATLAIVWRGGEPLPNWLSDWDRGEDVILTGKPAPTYVQAFPAGEVRLGGVYNPGSTSNVSRYTYLVLLAEADGAPSPAPAAPAGRETPVPNQPCPDWVHDQYVTTGPDGKTYPTWHPQIDPVYWCYFGHEHGSDPDLFVDGYRPPYGYASAQAEAEPGLSSNFLCDVETVNAAANIVLSPEPHVGFKSYVFSDGTGYRWLMTHHFGTASLKRACVRFHTVDIVVAEESTGELLADLHFMGDFGKSVAASADASDAPLRPSDCPDQAAQADADGTSGVRKIQVASRDRSGYEPWRIDGRGNILGLNTADLTFATRGNVVICDELVCDQPVETGHEGEFRFLTFHEGFALIAGANTGQFYTDAYGKTLMQAGQAGAVRQYIKPGLNLSNLSVDGYHWWPTESWQMLYVKAGTPRLTSK
jgi:hypothetical protein